MAKFLSTPSDDDEFARRFCKTRNVVRTQKILKIIHESPDVVIFKSKYKRVPRTTICCWVLTSDTIGNKFLTNELLQTRQHNSGNEFNKCPLSSGQSRLFGLWTRNPGFYKFNFLADAAYSLQFYLSAIRNQETTAPVTEAKEITIWTKVRRSCKEWL